MKKVHTCHAIGCDTKTKPEKLMCLNHWSMVPKDIQEDICFRYRYGQCNDQRPSKEWLKAARKAITYIRHAEGKASILRTAES